MSTEQEEGISLLDFLNILSRNIWVIAATIVVFMAFGFIYIFGIAKPVYQSKCSVMVQFENQTTETSDISNSLKIVVTVAEFMQDEMILKKTASSLKEQNILISPKEIKSGLTVHYSSTSLNITVKFESNDKDICPLVVDQIIHSAEQTANNTLNENGDPYYKSICNAISQIGKASEPVDSSTSKILLVLIFFLSGGVLGVLLALLRNLLTNYIHDKEEIEREFDVLVVGVIPEFPNDKGGKHYEKK